MICTFYLLNCFQNIFSAPSGQKSHFQAVWRTSLETEDFIRMQEYMKNSNWVWVSSWDGEDKEVPRIVNFRKKIDLQSRPKRGNIRISADSRYKLCEDWESGSGELAEI